ncbi:MAG: ParA family protein [Myxococcota bacterium]
MDLPGWRAARPFRVVSVSSNKGGVGKTTVAANLAVYLRALHEDDPVLMVGFDDQTSLDRMFALDLDAPTAGEDLEAGLRMRSLSKVVRFGQYGVEYVPSSRDVPRLRALIERPTALQQILLASERTGTIVLDTKSDFEILTQSSILSSDLAVVVVKDQASLIEAKRVFDLLEANDRPRTAARVLLSLVDLRVKYREGETEDVLGHLLSEIRRLEYPVFETFISRSPKVESLYTNPEGRAHAILQGAEQTVVHRQMRQLTREVDGALEAQAREAPLPAYFKRSPFGH